MDRVVLAAVSGEGRQHLVEVRHHDALARPPDVGQEPFDRHDLRRRQVRKEGLLDIDKRPGFRLRHLEIGGELLLPVFFALLILERFARGFARQFDEERRHLNQPRRPVGCDGDPPEVGQEEPAVPSPVLSADVDGDVFTCEPRTGEYRISPRKLAVCPMTCGRRSAW